ncbi:MAG: PqqD family protein [Candidatus Omnitrophica bacterium]|nr:PqqD family protein [Candidatus Omnitrophota bacterium]MDD5238196.1 PqqD family protein [Candidatus Omnitrophota bacterium]
MKKELLLINPDIVSKDMENERYLFNPVTGCIQVINEMGKFIYMNCNGRFSKNEIIEMVVKNYTGASQEKIRKQVNGFLEKMIRMDLIQSSSK